VRLAAAVRVVAVASALASSVARARWCVQVAQSGIGLLMIILILFFILFLVHERCDSETGAAARRGQASHLRPHSARDELILSL
jgi:hypothetical protein